jgi:hypothetical protein
MLRANGIDAPIIPTELLRLTMFVATGRALRTAGWCEEFRVIIV